jgi:amidase
MVRPMMGVDTGPMGHSPRDIKLYSKAIVDTKPWLVDPKVVEIPWRVIELPAHLSFAVIKSNGVVNPLPPISRGIDMTIQKLKEKGHEIIEWQLNDQQETSDLIVPPCFNEIDVVD